MTVRENLRVPGIPFIWTTNLSDEEIREFYLQYSGRISEKESVVKSEKGVSITLRQSFLLFLDGFCIWSASGDKHTVHFVYRSNYEWDLFDARQAEIGELREEQATDKAIEKAIEKRLVYAQDNYLREKTELALKGHDYDVAAAHTTARADLWREFNRLCGKSPHSLNYEWAILGDPVLVFARFPTSRHGIEFLRKYRATPEAFVNFAYCFAARCGLESDKQSEQVDAIYEAALSLFPENTWIIQTSCLYWRKMGRYDMAIAICADAIKKGLKDQTKTGFEGRLRRLEKERAKKASGLSP